MMVECAQKPAAGNRSTPNYSQVALLAPVKERELAPIRQAYFASGKSNHIVTPVVVFNFKS